MIPFFSIVTVVLNGEKFLDQTINSVLNQNNTSWELIIIDGGSTDGTLDIIHNYQNKITKWISEQDKGIYNAMNKGIKLASGDFISFLNADDYYFPETLDKVANAIKNFDADMYHGNVLILPRNGKVEKATVFNGSNNIKRLGRGDYIYQPATFIKKNVFDRIGLFNEKLRIVSDYDFFLRAEKDNCSFYHIDETLTAYRTGGISNNYKSFLEAFCLLKYFGTPKDYLNNSGLLIKAYSSFIKSKLLPIARKIFNK